MSRSTKLKQAQQKYFANHSYARLYISSKSNAHIHNIEHTLTVKDIKELMPAVCPIFNVPFTNITGKGKGGRAPFNPSLDRKDPTKGYTKDNVWIISFLANRMKQNATEEELVQFAKGILHHYDK